MTKRLLQTLLLLSFASTLTACETFSKTKRYDGITTLPSGKGEMHWNADVLVLPVPAKKPKTKILADLPERAQRALIEASRKEDEAMSASALGALMATKITAVSQQVNRDWTKVPRRIAVSIDYSKIVDEEVAPADRIDSIRADFFLSQPNIVDSQGAPISIDPVKFSSWSRLENQRRKIDLAELVFTQENKLGAEAGLTTLSPDLDTLGLSGSVTRGLTETLKLKEDQLSIYGALDDSRMFYVEKGAPLTDLGGMTFVDVTLELPHDPRLPFGIESFKVEKSKPKLAGGTYRIPDTRLCDKEIEITPQINLTARHVVTGGETYLEGDDKVAYLRDGGQLSPVTFLARGEVNERPMWGIYSGSPKNPSTFLIVRKQNSPNLQDPAFFTNRDAASNLLEWLEAEAAKPAFSAQQPILIDGYELLVQAQSGGQTVTPQGSSLKAAISQISRSGIRVSGYFCN